MAAQTHALEHGSVMLFLCFRHKLFFVMTDETEFRRPRGKKLLRLVAVGVVAHETAACCNGGVDGFILKFLGAVTIEAEVGHGEKQHLGVVRGMDVVAGQALTLRYRRMAEFPGKG